MSEAKKPRRDLYQEVTDKIVAAIEAGTAPWQRPWNKVASAGMPMNGVSSRPYNGVNALLLMMATQTQAYSDNRWFTFKQVNELGAKVKKGSKSTPVYFFKMLDARDGDEIASKAGDTKHAKQIPFLTEYRVFHASQIDGIEAIEQPQRQWTPIQALQEIVDRLKPIIRYGGDRAFFAPGLDFIQMPPEGAFPNAGAFAGTLTHEISHWSGGESRLNRKFGTWGTDDYSEEELRAEICSACLCAEFGIPTSIDNHAAYVGSWVKKLREDKFAIFRAAKDARRMADFITGRLVLDAAHISEVGPEKSPAPSVPVRPMPNPALANADVNALLAKVRTTSKSRNGARHSGLMPVGAVLGVEGGVGQSLGS
jgi:antirestriction protein ArdC